MHELCYVNLSAVEAEQPAPSSYELNLVRILATVPTASHAEMDEIYKTVYRMQLRGKREKLAHRRSSLINMLEGRIRAAQRGALRHAKFNNFIGPLTVQQQNGHPF